MPNDITYNQIISLTNDSLTYQTIKKSFTEHGKHILILDDSKKIIVAGKNIDISGHKNKIRELVSMVAEKVLKFLRSQ